MSHHQLEDGRAEMNNHAFPHTTLRDVLRRAAHTHTLRSVAHVRVDLAKAPLLDELCP